MTTTTITAPASAPLLRRYAKGQIWRSARGHRRIVLGEPYDDARGLTWLRVGASERDPGHMVTTDEMDAWVAKHNAKLREARNG